MLGSAKNCFWTARTSQARVAVVLFSWSVLRHAHADCAHLFDASWSWGGHWDCSPEAVDWFFKRDNESLRVETRYGRAIGEFVLVIHRPDGSQQVERFADAASFRVRLETLETQLNAEHWTRTG